MSTRIESPNRREFLKGLAVGAGGYALGASLIHPEQAMGQSIEGNLEKVPMEARWNIAAGGLIFWSVTYFKEIYDTKGREQYLEHWKKASPLVAARSKGNADRLGLTGSDPKSAVEVKDLRQSRRLEIMNRSKRIIYSPSEDGLSVDGLSSGNNSIWSR